MDGSSFDDVVSANATFDNNHTLRCGNFSLGSDQHFNCTDHLMPEYEYDLYEPSLGIVILLSLCYGLISAGAIIGNSLVIYMVVNSRRMRTVTNFFIANLALSDVVIGTFSIPFQFQAALLQRWNLPRIMCNLCPFFQNVSVNTSIFTLIAIALDRYYAILYPFAKKSSKRETKVRIGFIWIFSVILAVPQIIAFKVVMVDKNVPQCIPDNISPEAFKWYMFALCFVQYFVPLCLLCFAYVRIALNLWGRSAPGEAEERRDATILRNKKKAIKVLMSVVFMFGLCWLPLQTYYVTSVIYEGINSFKYINIVWFICHWLAMSNSCVNPFIYFFCHDKFKKEFQDHFKSVFQKLSRRRGQRNQLSVPGEFKATSNFNSDNEDDLNNKEVTSVNTKSTRGGTSPLVNSSKPNRYVVTAHVNHVGPTLAVRATRETNLSLATFSENKINKVGANPDRVRLRSHSGKHPQRRNSARV